MKETSHVNLIKLDAKDIKILYELDLNARQSLSQIARGVGLSKLVVGYRINKMIKQGLIEGFSPIINIQKLNLINFRIFVKFQDLTKEKELEIINFITLHPEIRGFSQGGGEYDVIIAIFSKTIEEFEDVLDEINSKYGQYIQQKYVSIATKTHNFRHKFLFEKKEYFDEEIIDVDIPKGRITFWDLFPVAKDFSEYQDYMVDVMDISKKKINVSELIEDRFAKLAYDKIGDEWRKKEWKK